MSLFVSYDEPIRLIWVQGLLPIEDYQFNISSRLPINFSQPPAFRPSLSSLLYNILFLCIYKLIFPCFSNHCTFFNDYLRLYRPTRLSVPSASYNIYYIFISVFHFGKVKTLAFVFVNVLVIPTWSKVSSTRSVNPTPRKKQFALRSVATHSGGVPSRLNSSNITWTLSPVKNLKIEIKNSMVVTW